MLIEQCQHQKYFISPSEIQVDNIKTSRLLLKAYLRGWYKQMKSNFKFKQGKLMRNRKQEM